MVKTSSDGGAGGDADVSSGESRLAREEVRVSAVLQSVHALVLAVAVQRSVELRIVCAGGTILAEKEWLVRLLANLALDAIELTPPGGRVALTGQPIEGEVVFGVYATRSPTLLAAARHGTHVDRRIEARIAAHRARLWGDHDARDHLVLLALPAVRGVDTDR